LNLAPSPQIDYFYNWKQSPVSFVKR
jgi:hypothetical protein